MKIQRNFPLSKLVTMKLGGRASFVITVKKKEDVPKALAFARERSLPWVVISGGSNVIGADAFKGVVILMRIGGMKRLEGFRWHFGAGVALDVAVQKTIDASHSGMECLSGIPGNIGGAPVCNAGAYGQEVSDVIAGVEAYDVAKERFVNLNRKECRLEYRGSVFKSHPGKYIITGVCVELSVPDSEMPINHPGLAQHLKDHGVTKVSPKILRRAVLLLRSERLPSLKKHASAGSFFKNPVLTAREFTKFHRAFPDAPYQEQSGGEAKIPAGWLLDQSGLRGVEKFGFVSYHKNALVVINKSAETLADLEKYTKFASQTVHKKFGITLKRDPDMIK